MHHVAQLVSLMEILQWWSLTVLLASFKQKLDPDKMGNAPDADEGTAQKRGTKTDPHVLN